MSISDPREPNPTSASGPQVPGQSAEAPSQLVRRRGCFGTIISGGCGCTAFLAGAALAIALAAPQLLSGVAADVIENGLEDSFDADVSVYDLELHWTEFQRARRVTVRTWPDEGEGENAEQGEVVAAFGLRFPSLLDLLTGPGAEWNFKVTDAKFTARVDEDGTSDLGRCLGMEAADGRSEIVALLGALGEMTAPSDEGNSVRSVTTTINTSSVQFIDMASGTGTDREEATISNFTFKSRKSRVGYQVELSDALVAHSIDQRAKVSFELKFGGASESPSGHSGMLRSAAIQADPVPLSVLRLMGFVPRQAALPAGLRGNGPRGRAAFAGQADAADFYRPMGEELLGSLQTFFEEGASLDLAYGLGDAAADGPRQLSVHSVGNYGEFHVSATHDGSWLKGSRTAGGDAALQGRFRLASGTLGGIFGQLAPPEGIEIRDVEPLADWHLQSDQYQIPLGALDFSVSGIFGGEPSAEARGGGGAPGLAAARAARMDSWSRHLARAMRRSIAEIVLFSRGVNPAKLVLLPSHPDWQSAYDQLDWRHGVTRLTLSGEMGATVSSRWSVGQSAIGLAELELAIPGTALGPSESLVPHLDVKLPAVPVSIVVAATELPDYLALLLPRRLDSLSLKGLALPHLLKPVGVPRRPQEAAIRVSATMDTTDRVEGVYERGTMTVPKATLVAPLDREYCERVIKSYMPWFESVEPRDDGSLKFELRDYSFTMGDNEFKQYGEVILRSDPLRVRLLPEIALKLTASEVERASQDDDGSGLVAWTPPPTLLTLDGLRVGYERVQLPLSDDYFTELEGSFYRGDGKFSLSGRVESQFIQGPEGDDALWTIAINGTATAESATARVTFDPGTIDPSALTDLVRRATELRDKAK